jgi:hypothetical protein
VPGLAEHYADYDIEKIQYRDDRYFVRLFRKVCCRLSISGRLVRVCWMAGHQSQGKQEIEIWRETVMVRWI